MTEASDYPLQIINSLVQVRQLPAKNISELMLFFDNLQADYFKHIVGMDVEYWQAQCFKYGLHEDEEFVEKLTEICSSLHTFMPVH